MFAPSWSMSEVVSISITSKHPESTRVPATSESIAIAKSSRSLSVRSDESLDLALLFLKGITALISPKRQGMSINRFGNVSMMGIFSIKPINPYNIRNAEARP